MLLAPSAFEEAEGMSGRLRSWERWDDGEAGPTAGFQSEAWPETVAFYRWEGGLWLRMGEEVIGLEGCEASWEAVEGRGRFVLRRDGAVVVEREYELSRELREFREGDTAFAEAEDFDLLLLVANVLGDAERRERMFRGG